MALTIVCANPLEYERELKDLFLSNERADYPEFFDRAYPSAVRAGANSRIGLG